ncbi:SPOR domain-containing protein [Cereibacter sediminicola]|uniref:SPOR domain-containing protein n=1 Tax=Cereibacter sediminicola TaxID=2584941 RepID=UPI0011A98178|nr:SPOR domain-containing protein [Cereibacter sediminicola]
MLSKAVSAAICALVTGTGLALAQGAPAEMPPDSFRGPQYVDSQGCVFLRAGLGGAVTWVPRVTPDRKPLCGYPPSLAVAEPAPAVAEALPLPPEGEAAAPQGDTPAERAPTAGSTAQAAADAARATVAAAVAEPAPRRTAARRHKPQPVTIQPADATEALALRRLTLGPDEIRAAADLPSGVSCPASAPRPRRFATSDGGSTLLCTRPGGGLQGARVPRLPAPEMALLSRAPDVRQASRAAGHYVQVGAFARPGNAIGTRQRLTALGLPVAVAEGGALEIILAGPFEDRTATRGVLRDLRRAGFHDAFIR